GELPVLSGQHPQVVEAIAGSRAHGVVAARDADDAAVAKEHGPGVAVGLVQALEAEAVRPVEAVVVDLLEHGLAVPAVVLVRRERGPLTGLVERLADEEAGSGNPGGDHA